MVEITKFRRTLDRKFDVLNKVHPGPGARSFSEGILHGSLSPWEVDDRVSLPENGAETALSHPPSTPIPNPLVRSREKEREKQRKAATVLLN